MRNFILIIAMICSIYCCTNNKLNLTTLKNNDSVFVDSLNNKYQFQNDTLFSDSIIINNATLHFSSINRNEFVELIKNSGYNNEDFYFHKFNERFDSNAYRIKDSLFLRLKNNQILTFIDISADKNPMDYCQYKYVDFFPFINSYYIAGLYYEYWSSMLINSSTGLKTDMLQYISINPENNMIITYNWDEWALKSGGLKLYEISNENLILIADLKYMEEFPINNNLWSLSDVHFSKNDEIGFIMQFYNNKVSPFKYMKCFAKMKIIKKKI